MRGAAALLSLLLVIGCGGKGDDSLRVAAASNLEPALASLESELDLQITYGSSGAFVQQLANGAAYDLYLSADPDYPEQLVERGLADPANLFSYAMGRSVLWVPEGSSLDPTGGLPVLRDARRVAIANPRHAPYGEAAEVALRRAGLYEEVAPKLVLGENVAQAADFVVSGGADAGIVPRSLVAAGPLADVGRWAELPQAPALDQVGVVLDERAEPLRDLLLSDRGRRVLQGAGYDLPER